VRLTAVDRVGRISNSENVIDVVPVGGGVWLARCECDATERFHSADAGWEWVLSHPCPPATRVVDLTEPSDSRRD
jgi:hypothetical protein